MAKLSLKLPSKKVPMSDLVSPTPSKRAQKVIKVALQKSYDDQKAVSKKAAAIRGR